LRPPFLLLCNHFLPSSLPCLLFNSMVLDSRVCNSTNTLTVAQENFWDFVSSSDFDVVACELAPFTFPSLQLFFSSSRSAKLTCFILQSDNSWSPHKIGWTVSGACGVAVSFEFDSPTPKRSLPSSLPPPSTTADHPILIASPTDYHHHLHIPHTPRSQLSKYDLSFSLSSQGAKGRNRLCSSSTSPQPADLLFSLFTSLPSPLLPAVPAQQRQIGRVLLMPWVYGVLAFFSYRCSSNRPCSFDPPQFQTLSPARPSRSRSLICFPHLL